MELIGSRVSVNIPGVLPEFLTLNWLTAPVEATVPNAT